MTKVSIDMDKAPAGELVSDPPGRLYPRVSSPWLVLVGIAVVVAAIVFLLVTARDDDPEEARGDLTYIEGQVPKQSRDGGGLVASIADITAADVISDGDSLLFEATVAAPLAQSLKPSALELRWDISATDAPAWTLTVAIDEDARASLFSDAGYGAGTVDDTFSGEVAIEGIQVQVWLNPARVADFPEEFEWSLSTTLRAFRNEPNSPRVSDRFPDHGSARFER